MPVAFERLQSLHPAHTATFVELFVERAHENGRPKLNYKPVDARLLANDVYLPAKFAVTRQFVSDQNTMGVDVYRTEAQLICMQERSRTVQSSTAGRHHLHPPQGLS